MKKQFWLKISLILLFSLTVTVSFGFYLFSIKENHKIQKQSQTHLSSYFSIIKRPIEYHLKKSSYPSFSKMQKIMSLYALSDTVKTKVILFHESGLVLAHSQPAYQGKRLTRKALIMSLVKKHPEGWNLHFKKSAYQYTFSKSHLIRSGSDKYFLSISWQIPTAFALFVSYFKWTVLFILLSFCVSLLLLFLYMKSFVGASQFLFQTLTSTDLASQRRRLISYLSHTSNQYLKSLYCFLADFLKEKPNKVLKKQKPICFSDIVNQILSRAKKVYPHLSIKINLSSDIEFPVFSEKLFHVLWELIKNSQTAKSNLIYIHTYKKEGSWFCCDLEDNGSGMNEEQISKAKQLYFTTQSDRLGLGLSFAQSVLSCIGGLLKLSPAISHKGLKASLFIPLDYLEHIESLNGSSKNFIQKRKDHALFHQAPGF